MLPIGEIKNLKKVLTPSPFPIPRREKYSCVTNCNNAT